ncbi:hypothetical protein QAD02_000143 [Eretmocerus hayati]|uniref:Uncharacterized protein n=1 Tax=Eretmocerus hayati TaxID=131215 RepID=A0ACC2NEX2_9HYME|nr:hypothetical protein QAD02_000143 [Eretmocerus hayati]
MQHIGEQPADVFKDVVIIGNGPSGISLSYLLSGKWPHYTGDPHPMDEMLSARLQYSCSSVSTQTSDDSSEDPDFGPCLACSSGRREQLRDLSADLEGRNSGKPLSLLMDQLQHPSLDAGLDVPPLVDWIGPRRHRRHKVVEHVVLGKGPPGGAWHALDPNVLTVSLSRWMSLPGLDLRDWQTNLDKKEKKKLLYSIEKTDVGMNYNLSRVPIGTVAAYYKDYVVKQGLEKYFRCGTIVTSVRPVPEIPKSIKEYGWLVQGYEIETGEKFQYRCKRVVLATGTTDLSNRLGVPGEDTYNWVTHDFKDFERKLDRLNSPLRAGVQINDPDESGVEPVLVVGSGLSAADAIMAARFRGVPVLHVFRRDQQQQQNQGGSSGPRSPAKLQWLPSSIYPEYHEVYEMMGAERSRGYTLYRPLPDHRVCGFSLGSDSVARAKTRNVCLVTPSGRRVVYRVSLAAVLIGSKPDLSYLENGGLGLGKNPEKPIDSRSNQMDIDPLTYEVERAPRPGLHAIGPLAGDNFVRFILGGAFGVLCHILNAPD